MDHPKRLDEGFTPVSRPKVLPGDLVRPAENRKVCLWLGFDHDVTCEHPWATMTKRFATFPKGRVAIVLAVFGPYGEDGRASPAYLFLPYGGKFLYTWANWLYVVKRPT